MSKRVTKSIAGFILLGMLIASLPVAALGTTTTASAPQYAVITERNVMATMRDGTKLAADIHCPNAPGQFPAIVIRTPYNKISAAEPYVPFFPQHGYVVVVQDVRGRYASEGVFGQNKDDGWGKNQDGYDTIEWVAEQPWSNGKVAVTGISAPASSGALLMPTQPPHLTAGVLEVSGVADSYVYRFYNGGVFKYYILRWLLGGMAPDIVSREVKDPVVRDKVLTQLKAVQTDPAELQKAFLALPLDPTTIVGNLNVPGLQFWKDWLTNQTRSSYWDDMSALTQTSRMNVPTAHVSGWFDIGLQGTIDQFNAIQSNGGPGARGKQKIVIGPWVHATNLWVDEAGELTFPGGKMNGREGYLLRYFDTYLKGLPTGLQDEPPILIYVMGDDVWRSENEWPLARTRYTNYYFRDGAAGSPIDSLNGNKLLSTEKPTGAESTDSYAYDPAKPVWTLGGRKLYAPQGPTDHRGAERQSLTFTTPPMEKDVEVTGQVKGVIYAMSTAPDTDWVVRLTDVYPDGSSMWVAEGILRASFRDSLQQPSLIEPDKSYKYEIDMWATSQVFKKGHSIRVTVTSSDFPHYARNLNTGKDNHTTTEMQVAYQTIFHDVKRPSHVVLPIIPRN